MLFFVETLFCDLAIHWSEFQLVWLGSTDKGGQSIRVGASGRGESASCTVMGYCRLLKCRIEKWSNVVAYLSECVGGEIGSLNIARWRAPTFGGQPVFSPP